MKRIVAFITVVVVVSALMGWTTPGLLKSMRLGLDLKGGFEILYEASPLEAGAKVTKESLVKTAQSLEKRANKLGTSEPEVTTEGTNRIRVKLAGVTDEAEVRKMMKEPAELTFRSKDGTEKNADEYNKIEMIGTDFAENGAALQFDNMNKPQVSIKVKSKDKFAEITKRLLGQPLAIYMNDELISAPVVQAVLTDGTASISVGGSMDEAKELRDVINLGALPLKLHEKYSQSLGATLGQQSLKSTIEAGLIGSVFILVFMVGMYRAPGLIASFALILHTWLLIAVFAWANFTLTLPGIAAIILGIGMAVDANIITNERIREELRSGKSVMSSVKAGGKHSLRTVLDSNITTIIVAIVMYIYGTGSVKGFALVLIVEIVLSIATNVYFVRFLLNLLLKAGKLMNPKYFGVKESEIRAL
ncbi:protein translocase subunit SecD [Paenibacillus motobuensis]|uniref:protein translocase subunit SecD n=1 Tax=Paenibacillus TaxID=44249 RepID=UPI00203EDF4A|nr:MULTISPECIES: protein translocase subunit SecD [Paenibacillus]MCM3042176.1 protein translocase subunit SecD [Paenibacillus lutimineralis]MCM3649280.1 protein translocase subunit SecD [Paenibacillus motobuensis]